MSKPYAIAAAVGSLNETPWGVLNYLQLSKDKKLPRMMSIQNPYSLLNRSYEVGLAEVSIRENIGCLSYSPLVLLSVPVVKCVLVGAAPNREELLFIGVSALFK